jgi:hypothetical protein
VIRSYNGAGQELLTQKRTITIPAFLKLSDEIRRSIRARLAQSPLQLCQFVHGSWIEAGWHVRQCSQFRRISRFRFEALRPV